MNKILFLIESLSGGGAEKVLVTLLNNLDRQKFDICLCTVVDTGINRDILNNDIKRVSIISEPKVNFFSKLCYWIKYQLVYRLLPLNWVYKLWVPKDYNVEIAFVEGFATKLLSHSNSRQSRKIAWVHIDLINYHWISNIFKNHKEEYDTYHKYDKIVGVSKTVTQSIESLYSTAHATTLYNPIDYISIKQLSTKESILPSSDRIRIVSAGRLVHQKGFQRLINILYRLTSLQFDIELYIFGEGDERNILEQEIASKGLTKCVFLPGFLENPYAELVNADIFVCSSVSEGYSTAVTEALILGLPVVTTDCSGMRELLGDSEYGLITDNDEESLFNGLYKLLTQPELRLHYRNKAQERSRDFKIEKLMQPIENLLAE